MLKQSLLAMSAALLLTSCEYYGPEPVKEESPAVIVAAPDKPVVVAPAPSKRKVVRKRTPQQKVMKELRETGKAIMALPAPAEKPPLSIQAP